MATTILGKEITALSASYATTASFALTVAGGGGGAAFPFTGSALITGSLGITGSLSVSGSIIARNSTASPNALARWSGSAGGLLTLTGSILNANNGQIWVGFTPSSTTLASLYPQSSAITTGLFIDQGYFDIAGTGIYSAGGDIGVYGQGGRFGGTDPIGGQFIAEDGTTGIGVYGGVYISEFGSMTTGIGGYFNATGISGTYGSPTNAYSVQLVDGTEGIGKVLVSQTSDGKARWQQTVNSASVAATASFVNPLNQNVTLTGSLRGNVSALSIASNTASVDMSTNNFFTLALVNGANTFINPTNLNPGQTVNIRVTQGSLGTGTVSFPTFVDQASGSAYTGTAVANAIDIVTMITFDSSLVFMSSIRNMI